MTQLFGTSATFTAADTGTITDPEQRTESQPTVLAPKRSELKKGSQVMLIKNLKIPGQRLSWERSVVMDTTWDYRHEDAEDFEEPDEHTTRRQLSRQRTGTPQLRFPPCSVHTADGNFEKTVMSTGVMEG